MDITLRNMQSIKRDSPLPHDIEESASIVVGNVPELSEVFLQFLSSFESPAARLDHLLCTYRFDLIPCPRDVFVGLSLFVWWTALCVVSGYAISQYVCCDVIGSGINVAYDLYIR